MVIPHSEKWMIVVYCSEIFPADIWNISIIWAITC